MLEQPSEALSSDHVTLSFKSDAASRIPARNSGSRASESIAVSPTKTDRRQSVSSDKPRRPQPYRAKSEGHTILTSSSPRPQARPHQLQQSPQPVVDPKLPSVLVVDDNQINLQLLVTFVRKTRHPYGSAMDGALALEAYKKSATDPRTGQVSKSAPKRFKYILMDINMPNMDGSTATREIRKFEKDNGLQPPVTIFAFTGIGELEHPWAREAGFDRLLSKPVKFTELKELLV